MRVLHLKGAPPYAVNCFLIISDKGRAMVVDPGLDAKRINDLLEENGAELCMILLTHGHFDHVEGVPALAAKWGCMVFLDPADQQGTPLFPLPSDLITLPYSEETPITLDDITIRCWHTPGHSEGSWLLGCEDLVFCGDTVFEGSVGRTDFEGGDPAKQKQSIEKIKGLGLERETQLLPGHGPFTTLGNELDSNPYFMF